MRSTCVRRARSGPRRSGAPTPPPVSRASTPHRLRRSPASARCLRELTLQVDCRDARSATCRCWRRTSSASQARRLQSSLPTTEETAQRAAGMIVVEYEEMTPLLDALEAAHPDAPLLHPTWLCTRGFVVHPRHHPTCSSAPLSGSATWTRGSLKQTSSSRTSTSGGRTHPAFFEPRCCVVSIQSDGRAHVCHQTKRRSDSGKRSLPRWVLPRNRSSFIPCTSGRFWVEDRAFRRTAGLPAFRQDRSSGEDGDGPDGRPRRGQPEARRRDAGEDRRDTRRHDHGPPAGDVFR